jgi:hypothetical protein
MNKPNIFHHTPESPAHISVGAVVFNDQGQILVHYWQHIPKEVIAFEGEDVYLLMRESLEANESLEQAVHRGLMEEFGTTAEIVRYLGPIISNPPHFQKTTLYFLCRLINFDPEQRIEDDVEGGSELKFMELEPVIQRMQEQGKQYQRDDIDESTILEKTRTYIA